jgi:drug/metabolite transporter (DMT)-like permease
MNKNTKNAKQFVLGCAGATAGAAFMLLGRPFGLHWLCGMTIWFITGILCSSEENAVKRAPLVVVFLLCQMALVICSIYNPIPHDSDTFKPPTWYAIFMITIWATSLCWECWTYFRRRSPKDNDHVA